MNPYPERVIDEASGIEVPNDAYYIWKEGYEAGILAGKETYMAKPTNREGGLMRFSAKSVDVWLVNETSPKTVKAKGDAKLTVEIDEEWIKVFGDEITFWRSNTVNCLKIYD